VLGLVSVATMPVAVFATRYSGSYELTHAALAIPLGLLTGWLAIRYSRTRAGAVPLERRDRSRLARWLGLAGLWLAGASLVAIGFYALLEYLGTT
jgi:hypothetical protein